MRLLIRLIRRLLVLGLGILAVWLIAFVFQITDHRLPTILTLAFTYAIAAYVILPRIVRMGLKVLQRKSVPSFTLTGDGFPGDPVNLVLAGEFVKLRAAFAGMGWTEADPLGLKSSWGMAVSFVFNRPYPTAPFSSLYLFGRKQDIGFQKAIDGSPRKRHHVRFWALSPERVEETVNTPDSGSTPIGRRSTRRRCGSAPAPGTPGFRSPNSLSNSPMRRLPTPTPNAISSLRN